MIVMKFGGTSVQNAQAIDRVAAIVREHLHENLATISALTNTLAPGNNPAPKARKSLAQGSPTRAIFAWRGGGHPEASNAKPEGWVGHKMRSSPVGATQNIALPCLTDNLFPSSTFRPTEKQVSGHEFTRAVQPKKNTGFSPCSRPQGLKAKFLEPHTARLKSCPDTYPDQGNDTVLLTSPTPLAFLRASVPPWWVFSGVPS
jgi:hypothetical protein